MPISVVCPECNRSLNLREELAGKRIRCTGCDEILRVPEPVEVVGDEPIDVPAEPIDVQAEPTVNRAEMADVIDVAAEPIDDAGPKKRQTQGERVTKKRSRTRREPSADASESVLSETLSSANPESYGQTDAPTADAYNQRYDKFLSAFKAREIEPVPTTGTYQFAVFLVCAFMLSLPFLYLTTLAVLCILMPLIMLPLMLLLIVKPLFSGFGRPTGRRSLKRDDEPLLFDFVDRICEAVNAPYPTQINVDSQVNASAGFRRGALSMFGSDLTLTIGMPLVAGLNSRQFAGVLAHEFGHFSQGAGMRVSYLIRNISMWFARIVYERDRLDAWLETLSEELPSVLGLFFLMIRGLVWLCRRVMWVFMRLGNLVSGYMLRQMEFDADRHEARLAGSKCFAQTARRLIHMTIAHQGAMADLHEFYREGRLADNLPRLIIANVDQLDDKAKRKIRELVNKTETSVFDTHPCDRDRVTRARDEQSNGIFRLEEPAEFLFRRYDYQARAVTWDMYCELFGKVKKTDIHPVEQLLARQQYQKENYEALFRFFQCAPSWYRPLKSPQVAVTPPRDPRASVARVRDARERMIKLADSYSVAWKKYDRADTRLIECELAESLLKARLRVPRDLFKVPLFSYDDIERREDAAHYIQSKQEPHLAPFEDAAAERLYSALRLLRAPVIHERLPHHEALVREVDELVDLFGHVNARLGQLLAIRNDQITLGLLISMIDGNESNRRLFRHIHDTLEALHELIHDLYDVLDRVPYPFDHANEDMTMGAFMLPKLPEEENPAELYEAADAIGNSLPAMQARVLGRMCQIAEEVETALGLEPLPQPDLDDDDEDEDE